MKLKLLISVIFVVIGLSFSASAHEMISINTIDYQLIKERVVGNVYVRMFRINITLINQGDENSGNISVEMTDQEGFTLRKIISLMPGESKTVTFYWNTTITEEQVINITYAPATKGVTPTSYNSGKESIVIDAVYEIGMDETPGFEFILFAIAVLIFVFGKRLH